MIQVATDTLDGILNILPHGYVCRVSCRACGLPPHGGGGGGWALFEGGVGVWEGG